MLYYFLSCTQFIVTWLAISWLITQREIIRFIGIYTSGTKMSESSLIPWINFLLFGDHLPCSTKELLPPCPLDEIFLRMEVSNLHWREIGRQGGLTRFASNVHRDLDMVLEHVENDPPHNNESATVIVDPPPFLSGTIRRFFDHLSILLVKKKTVSDEKRSLFPPPDISEDRDILNHLVRQPDAPGEFSYRSASFWGELARRMMKQRRALQLDCLAPLHATPSTCATYDQRALRLFRFTCEMRGERYDPFEMYLVPHSEHVDAIHWQSDRLLEAFVLQRPQHPLSRSVQNMLKRCVDDILSGRHHPILLVHAHPELNQFLVNVRVTHEEIPNVERGETPPLTTDVFHRLLALAGKDHLWQVNSTTVQSSKAFKEGSSGCADRDGGMNAGNNAGNDDENSVCSLQRGFDVFHLTERLLMARRQNMIVMQHIPDEANGTKSAFGKGMCVVRTDTPRWQDGRTPHLFQDT